MRKWLIKCFVCICMMLSLYSTYSYVYARYIQNRHAIFSSEELTRLRYIAGEDLSIGYVATQETDLLWVAARILQEYLDITVSIYSYEDFESLEHSVLSGDIDILIDLESNKTEVDIFNTLTFPVINDKFIFSHIDAPLENLESLSNKRLGFRTASALSIDYEGLHFFFDTDEEAFEALSRKDIDAFITRRTGALQGLITMRDLQLEFSFQHNIFSFQAKTLRDDLIPLVTIFNDIMKSERAQYLKGYADEQLEATLLAYMRDFLMSEYSTLLTDKEPILVVPHDKNFPFVYRDTTSGATGIYMEQLYLLSKLTGIDYHILYDLDLNDTTALFKMLGADEVQFLLGFGSRELYEGIVPLSQNYTSNFVSIVTFENYDIDTWPVSRIRFGLVTTPKEAENLLGNAHHEIFEDYSIALNALLSGEIDVLTARESLLAYYRNVRGYTSLRQATLMSGISKHNFYGNKHNVQLNALMQDVIRFYHILNPENIDFLRDNLAVDYQAYYLKMRARQERLIVIGIAALLIVVVLEVGRMRRQNKRLRHENERDKLTGLYTRAASDIKSKDLLKKNSTKNSIFIFFDLDDLKLCNDTYGHHAGDQLIKEFANKLRKFEDKTSVCTRIAGDEFSYFKAGIESEEEFERLIERMYTDLRGDIHVTDDITISLKFSAGVSKYTEHASNYSDLKKYADLAMYQAKRKKKEVDRLERQDITIKVFDENTLNLLPGVIDSIIAEEQIHSVYQEINVAGTGEVYGYEGLTRVEHESVSNIGELLTLAEMHERTYELDLLMMRKIVRGYRRDKYLFINMEHKTPEQVRNYIEDALKELEACGLTAEHLVLELSERNKWDLKSIEVVKELRSFNGFRIAIDDFGIGFSNSYLLFNLKPDIVKIDRSLISQVDIDTEKTLYLKALVEFLKKQQDLIIYEGVEEKAELDIIVTLDKNGFGQGWYFDKPKRQDIEDAPEEISKERTVYSEDIIGL